MIPKLEQWLLAHHVSPAVGGALFPRLLAALLGNAVVAYLVIIGRAQPLELVLFVALEAMLLSAVEAVQMRFAPRREAPPGFGQMIANRLGLLLLCLLILLFNGLVIASMAHLETAALAMARHPLAAIHRAGLEWPLAITLVAALFDVRRDARRYAEQGGDFVSTPGRNAGARWVTLFFGAMPHAVPLLAYVAVSSGYFRRRAERLQASAESAPVSRVAMVALGAYLVATLALVSWLLSSGLAGWALAFFISKLTSEVLFILAPATPAKPAKPASPAVPKTTTAPRRKLPA